MAGQKDISPLGTALGQMDKAVLGCLGRVADPRPVDQHAAIDEALSRVEALRSLPDLRAGSEARIFFAERALKRLRLLTPRYPGHPAESADRECHRGCYLED
ncbi:hypothetical protein [Desulfovibrio aminophilus]|uniref:hypothetical protein n=1 Tax=Desulfovibrio aminophilus TaxID=81425 RepID=UPI00041EEE15|nr:hypothetical protein [Desulfovibrio aminophilus]